MSATAQPALHTPGPWTSCDDGKIRGSNGDPVGEMVLRRPLLAEAKRVMADRHILGTALDAVEALRHVVRWHDQLTQRDVERLQAIIDQSEGRT